VPEGSACDERPESGVVGTHGDLGCERAREAWGGAWTGKPRGRRGQGS
jgi:hypothetical protein